MNPPDPTPPPPPASSEPEQPPGASPDAARPPSPPPPHPHRWLVRSLIGVATVLGVVAIFAVWANRQLLDSSYWGNTSEQMIQSPPIREALAGYLTEQLYANVDVAGELRGELPSELKPLAAPAAGALRSLVEKGVNLALERPRVQELWRKASEASHAEFVKLIENRGQYVRTGHGEVVIDLRPLLSDAAGRVGAPTSVVEKIPPNVAELHVVKSNSLKTMQDAVNVLRSLALVLPLLVYLLFALAVFLARGRRRETLMMVGWAFIGAALAVLVVRGVAGHSVVNSLASTDSVKPAVEAAYAIGTSVLREVAWATIYIGIALILASLLAGPTRPAVAVRRFLAPYLREHADLSYGAVALLLLLLLWWGPIAALHTFLGILIVVVLVFFGFHMLRREIAGEFDAR